MGVLYSDRAQNHAPADIQHSATHPGARTNAGSENTATPATDAATLVRATWIGRDGGLRPSCKLAGKDERRGYT